MIRRFSNLIPAIALLAALSGCASYRPRPLALTPPLAGSLAALDRTLPGHKVIEVDTPLPLSSVAALAVLNDPALAAARAQMGIAQAQVFATGLLPDPAISGSLGLLLGGPAVASSVGGSLAEDVSALITRASRLRAAKATAAEARANFLWQEWQVATQAETLATLLWAEQRNTLVLNRERLALRRVVITSRNAVAHGNLTVGEGAIAAANLASLDATRDVLAQQTLTDHAALAALLGVAPMTAIPIATPRTVPIPADLAPRLVASLPYRRPDLIALRFGYLAANQNLRTAILSEFSGLTLGVIGGSDTSRVATVGPTISVNLPVFNGNRGNIAVAKASRRQLKAAFTASLAGAEGGAQQAELALAILERERAAASRRLAVARRDTEGAERAFRNQLIDLLSYTALISQQATRQTELITLDQKIAAGRIALASLLAPSLPTLRVTSIKTGYHP